MRKLVFAWLVLGLFVSQSLAAAQPPQQLVEQTAQKVLGKLKTDRELIKKDPGYIHGLVDEYVLPHFDFEGMGQWVLGKYWRTASESQRSQFVAEFRTLLVRTYATSLTEFTDQKITYLPMRGKEADGDVTVRSEVEQPGSFPVPINYRLHKKGDAWKVYDVTIDDVSLIANYRTSFSREIKDSGMDKLIQSLAERNKKAGS
ncbi:MAG: ABC transporter substrate-binding protein [Gammaproteobacteria bacterium]|nr:ABC transporter substrate-binding protein [Gammaproteobacteria bacterium]